MCKYFGGSVYHGGGGGEGGCGGGAKGGANCGGSPHHNLGGLHGDLEGRGAQAFKDIHRLCNSFGMLHY